MDYVNARDLQEREKEMGESSRASTHHTSILSLKVGGGGRGNYARSWTKIHQNKKADEERKKNLHVRSF